MLLEERVARPTTEAEAVELARDLYGLAVTAKSLPGEYDDNFHLMVLHDAQPEMAVPHSNSLHPTDAFVLKVMHPARERSFIDMQCRALQHLAQRAPHLTLPRVRPNRNGEAFAAITAVDGSQRLVWLLSYVPGTILAKARPHAPELLRSLGNFLGEMDAALADFTHHPAARELKWDLTRAGWIRAHLHHIRDASQRTLFEKFLSLYETEVVPALSLLRRSVVYGDANDYNVLVGRALPLPRNVVSVIDFGDMHETVTVSEVAIAAAYSILGEENPLRAAAEVVRGYHRAFPLTEAELRTASSVVFDFSVGSRFLGADPAAADPALMSERIFAEMKHAGASVGVGRYAEARPIYTSALFGSSENPTDERRTIHLGMDLQVQTGSAVRAPLDGVVHAMAHNHAALDYGPVVIL